jgi:hypothetical protein
MGAAIGEMLPLAIGIAISPLPIIAIILILTTSKARTNGLAFLGGWVLGLAVVGVIVLVVADSAGAATSGDTSTIVSTLKLVLGLLLLFLAWRKFQKRPRPGEETPMPKWMRALDDFTPGRCLAMGALLSGPKPKNLILNAAAAAGIAQSGIGGFQQAVVLIVLIIVGSLGIIAPVGVYFAMGDRSAKVLGGWKTWLAANNATVMIVLFVVFGVTLIGKGISGLS